MLELIWKLTKISEYYAFNMKKANGKDYKEFSVKWRKDLKEYRIKKKRHTVKIGPQLLKK